jgi:predicted alpha/beta-fold hydrolase
MPFLNSLVEVRKFYDFVITRRMVRLIKRHREKLFGEERVDPDGLVIPPSLVDEGRDMNGFLLSGRVKISPDTRLWTSNTITEFDEYYTRRIMGFDTPIDVYKWASCKSFLTKPSILPIVIVNALDDPVIPNILHTIASEYVLKYNPNAIFIQTQHGGHLAYYEGGVVAPNKRSWLDRLIFEYIPISIKHWNTSNVFKNQ